MNTLKIDKKLLLKIGTYMCPNEKNISKIADTLSQKLVKSIKIKDLYLGYCYEEFHFVVSNEEIVEFFIVADKKESKWSIAQKQLKFNKEYRQEINFKILDTIRKVSSSKEKKEINYRIMKETLVGYKKNIIPRHTIWVDGSLKKIDDKTEGFSSVIISDENQNIIYQEVVKLGYAKEANETEVFALLLAFNQIQKLGLGSPIIYTDSNYAFIKFLDKNSKCRKNIDDKYGKRSVSWMLTNFKNEKRTKNIAHNLIENRESNIKEVSIDEMMSLGYVYENEMQLKEAKITQKVVVPNVITVQRKSIFKEKVVNKWLGKVFDRRSREIKRFEKRNKLKINARVLKHFEKINKNKNEKELMIWLENFINKSVEIRKNNERYLIYENLMLKIKDNEIQHYQQDKDKIREKIIQITRAAI